MKDTLNAKERAFVLAYVELKEGKSAAIKAGYSAKTAESKASQLLRIVKVKAEIDRLMGKLEEKVLITKERIIQRHIDIAFSDPSDVMTWTESGIDMIPSRDLNKQKRGLIKSLSHTTTATGESFKCEMQSQQESLKELAKLMGYYPSDKVEISGGLKIPKLNLTLNVSKDGK